MEISDSYKVSSSSCPKLSASKQILLAKGNIPIYLKNCMYVRLITYWGVTLHNPSVYFLSIIVRNYRVSVALTINIQWNPSSCHFKFFFQKFDLCTQMPSCYFSWICYYQFNLRISKTKMLFFFLWTLLCVSCIESWLPYNLYATRRAWKL